MAIIKWGLLIMTLGLAGCAHGQQIEALERRVKVLEGQLGGQAPGQVSDDGLTDPLAATGFKTPEKKMTTAGESVAVKDSVYRAKEFFVSGDYKRAMSRAKQALLMDPENKIALQVYGAASCHLGDRAKARTIYKKLGQVQQKYLRTICRRNGVRLGDGSGDAAVAPVPAFEPEADPVMATSAPSPVSPATQAAASPLTRQQIKAGMATARDGVASCYQQHGVSGLCLVKVTIASDGSVQSAAAVGGILGDTATGDCIAAALLEGATFPAFTGKPVTVTHPFILR